MRIKNIIFIIIVLLTFSLNCFIFSDENIVPNCKSAALIDYSTGKFIFEKNVHEKLEPASVTKIMTMLLVMEALESGRITLNDKVTISKNTSKMTTGTRLMLEEGEIRTVEDLLYGIAVESANDASIAIGEHISGSEEDFVRFMNAKARELKMKDTNFINPHGLHAENHVTSAHDICIMSRELIKHDKIFDYISKYMVTVYVGRKNDVRRELVNKNKMVRFYKDVDGIKTGFTEDAGFCISVTAKNNNLRLISVIMGAPDTKIRNSEARKLIDYGFANYVNYSSGKKGDLIEKVKVIKGDSDFANGILKENADVLLKKGEESNIEKIIDIPDTINAPINKNQKIGEVILQKNGNNIAYFDIICEKDIKKAGFLNNIIRAVRYWFN